MRFWIIYATGNEYKKETQKNYGFSLSIPLLEAHFLAKSKCNHIFSIESETGEI